MMEAVGTSEITPYILHRCKSVQEVDITRWGKKDWERGGCEERRVGWGQVLSIELGTHGVDRFLLLACDEHAAPLHTR